MAYGVTNVKFDSGDSERVTYTVLATTYSHAIAFYLEACKNSRYNPLSECSLGKILTAIKPSKQSLAGLDNTTVARMNSFKTLSMLSSKYQIGKTIQETLQKGKRYLKQTTRCIPTALFLHLTPIIYYLLFLM